MRRQWVGLLLLLLAVISLLAVQGLRGGRVAGNATATPISSPPRVGDCLLDPPDLTDAQAIYTQKPWVTGFCADQWYGEVTAVIDTPDDPSSWPYAADFAGTTSDPALFSCQLVAYDYVGATVSETSVVEWSPALRIGSVAIDPSARQKAAGQHWRACLAYVYPEDFEAAAVAANTQPLHDVIDTGAVPDALAICMSDAGFPSFEYLPCSQPHTIQLIALGSVSQPVSREDPLAGCVALAQQLTRRPDLATDEAFEISVVYLDFNQAGLQVAVIDDAEIPVGATAVCLIRSSAGRLLAGTLLGLGDRPIPWS